MIIGWHFVLVRFVFLFSGFPTSHSLLRDEVKLKREFSRNAPHLMKRTIAFGQAKRNKGHCLTFGDDEHEVEASSDEGDDVEKAIVLVVDEDDDRSTTPHLYEPAEGLNSTLSIY